MKHTRNVVEPIMRRDITYLPGIQVEEAIEITRHCFFSDEQMALTERVVRNAEEFSIAYRDMLGYWTYERYLTEMYEEAKQESYGYYGNCIVCNSSQSFVVDYVGAEIRDGKKSPNWRERLVCPNCRCNNRQRFMVHKVFDNYKLGQKILMYEQVSPVYKMVSRDVSAVEGFEYLGMGYRGGCVYNGVLNENICKLSYDNETFDLLVANDVFEHVDNYVRAFKEAYRVLRPGGKLLFTVPFNANSRETIKYAEDREDGIVYHKEALYHNSPIENMDALLVYQIFGWDMLDELKKCGFSEAYGKVYYGIKDGYIGYLPLYFEAYK